MADRQACGALHHEGCDWAVTLFKHFALGLSAAACFAVIPVGAAQAQTAAAPDAQATPQGAAQVVVIEQLMAEGPDQLPGFRKATEDLEREFGLPIQEMEVLTAKLLEAQKLAANSAPDSPEQAAAAQRVAELSRRNEYEGARLSEAIGRRQAQLFDPIIAQIQSKMQAFTDELGTGPVYLVSAAQLNRQPRSAISNVTSAFASWMKRQP